MESEDAKKKLVVWDVDVEATGEVLIGALEI